jgi:hypothetical protein
MNKTELKQSMKARIDELESNIAVLKKEMAELQEVEKPEKWNPKGGHFTLYSDGSIIPSTRSTYSDRMSGLEFSTHKAAESAHDVRIFFQRMQCLAAELNPSGKVGGNFEVYWYKPDNGWSASHYSNSFDMGYMFETKEAARKACEILNRDGVKPPATP